MLVVTATSKIKKAIPELDKKPRYLHDVSRKRRRKKGSLMKVSTYCIWQECIFLFIIHQLTLSWHLTDRRNFLLFWEARNIHGGEKKPEERRVKDAVSSHTTILPLRTAFYFTLLLQLLVYTVHTMNHWICAAGEENLFQLESLQLLIPHGEMVGEFHKKKASRCLLKRSHCWHGGGEEEEEERVWHGLRLP